MTDFIPFPEFTLTLPEDGKVRGTARLAVRGNSGVILTGSESRILSPTGKEFSVALELVREDGQVTAAADHASRGRYQAFTGSWETGFKPAPKTHAEQMADALIAEAQKVWTDHVEALGKIATASQALNRLERERQEAFEALNKIIDEQIKHQKDLDAAQALTEKEN